MRKKKGYRHKGLRSAIVDAAIAIADEEGIAAVTTRAIARRLGVSHNAPARHFESRADLLAEVAAAAFELFATALSTAGKSSSAQTSLAAMGRAYVRFGLEHPGLLHLMFSPELGSSEAFPERLRAASAQAYDVL